MSDISIDIAIKSADADKSIAEIKKSLIELKKVEIGSEQFEAAQKAATKYREKLDDLKDASKATAGSGVERLNSSLNLLSEGFKNADPGKIGIGFKALGTAMSAIPIFLLIEGIKLLIENFDKVSGFISGSTAKLKEAQAQYDATTLAATNLSKSLQREIDLLEAQGASEDKILAKKKEKFEQDLKAAEASYKLNTVKLLEIQANDSLYESYLRLSIAIYKFTGQSQAAEATEKALAINKKERSEEALKAQQEAQNSILDVISQSKVEVAKVDKKANDDRKKTAKEQSDWEDQNIREGNERIRKENQDAADKAIKDKQDEWDAQIDIDIKSFNEELRLEKEKEQERRDTQDYSREYFKKQEEEDKANREKRNKEIIAAFNSLAQSISSILNTISEYNQLKAEEAIKVNDEALATQLGSLEQTRDQELSREGLTADQKVKINEKYNQQKYQLELAEYNNNTAIRKKAFEQDKKMKIAMAVISTITGAIAAVTGMIQAIPGPVGIILGVVAGLAVTAAGVLQIAKIRATQFDAGTPPSAPSISGGGGVSSGQFNANVLQPVGGGPQAQSAPTQSTATSANAGPQKIYVVSSDVTTSQNRDEVIERRAAFNV